MPRRRPLYIAGQMMIGCLDCIKKTAMRHRHKRRETMVYIEQTATQERQKREGWVLTQRRDDERQNEGFVWVMFITICA